MNHQTTLDDADGQQLVHRMRDIRNVSRIHVADLQDEAQRLGDWREYVRARPLLSVAAAAAVGFALTRGSSRRNGGASKVSRADAASPAARVGVASGVMAFAASLAGNALREFALHKIRSLNDANHST